MIGASTRLLLVLFVIGCSSGNSHPETINGAKKSSPPLVTEVRSTGAHPEVDSGAVAQAAPSDVDDTEMEATTSVLGMICRDAWGAKNPIREYVRHEIRKLTVHHQGVLFEDNTRAPSRLKSMQRYHQSAKRNFADIAYHFVIDLNGNVYEGRPTWAAGETKTDYDPRGHLLVCLLGNFEEQTPTTKQIDTLVTLLAWASQKFDVPVASIEGHRDHAHTLCPGKNLHKILATTVLPKVADALSREYRVDRLCEQRGENRISEIAQ